MIPSEVLRRIHAIVPALDGWCTPERACDYAQLIMGLRMRTSVVIGVWAGRDVIPMSLAHDAIGLGQVHAVDPWQADASAKGQTGANHEWWSDQEKHEVMHDRFLSNLQRLGVESRVVLHRRRAVDVEPPLDVDLLVVDGNHGPDAVEDVRHWAPAVRVGGVVYCDDKNWQGGAVAEAIDLLRADGFRDLYERDAGLFLQRERR